MRFCSSTLRVNLLFSFLFYINDAKCIAQVLLFNLQIISSSRIIQQKIVCVCKPLIKKNNVRKNPVVDLFTIY